MCVCHSKRRPLFATSFLSAIAECADLKQLAGRADAQLRLECLLEALRGAATGVISSTQARLPCRCGLNNQLEFVRVAGSGLHHDGIIYCNSDCFLHSGLAMRELQTQGRLEHTHDFAEAFWLSRLLLEQAPLFEVLRQLMGPLLALGAAFSRHHPVALALLKLAGDCVEAHVSFLTVRVPPFHSTNVRQLIKAGNLHVYHAPHMELSQAPQYPTSRRAP